jgi:hypothetical protein
MFVTNKFVRVGVTGAGRRLGQVLTAAGSAPPVNPVSACGTAAVRIPVNGVELQVEERGAGPAVLLVHGFPDSSQLWRAQVPELAAGYRVITLDLREFLSEHPDVDEVLDHLRRPGMVSPALGLYRAWAPPADRGRRALDSARRAAAHDRPSGRLLREGVLRPVTWCLRWTGPASQAEPKPA